MSSFNTSIVSIPCILTSNCPVFTPQRHIFSNILAFNFGSSPGIKFRLPTCAPLQCKFRSTLCIETSHPYVKSSSFYSLRPQFSKYFGVQSGIKLAHQLLTLLFSGGSTSPLHAPATSAPLAPLSSSSRDCSLTSAHSPVTATKRERCAPLSFFFLFPAHLQIPSCLTGREQRVASATYRIARRLAFMVSP